MKTTKCILCNSSAKFYLSGYDFLYKTTNKKFDVFKCTHCQLEFIYPTPSSKEIQSFYPRSYYSYNIDTSEVRKGFFTKIREKIIETSYTRGKVKNIYYLLSLIGKNLFSGLPLARFGQSRFLDVGCGDGYNLRLMKKYGWTVEGFEIGEKNKINAIHHGADLSKVKFKNNKFDAIRVWHVLEHIPESKLFIKTLANLLDDKGFLYIGVPNSDSWYASFFRKYWYNRDIPRHICNYDPSNLALLFNQYGLKIRQIKYSSAGGFLGSLQHLINDKLKLNINLVDNPVLVLVFLPVDLLSNLFQKGDCISLEVTHDSF